MLNKSQKHFRKEMEKAQHELVNTKQEKIYSYIQDDKISNYYSSDDIFLNPELQDSLRWSLSCGL